MPAEALTETVPGALEGERVDRVVALLTGLPRRAVAALVEAGEVRLTGRAVTNRSQRVAAGDVLEVRVPEPVDPAPAPEPGVEFAVVHADSEVIVVDKPGGLVVHPGSGRPAATLVNGLLARYPELAGVGDPARPGIVHRLDAGTSGLLVVARTSAAYDNLVDQLARRAVERAYLALVWGHMDAGRGVIDAPLGRAPRDPTAVAVRAGGRPARTHYEVLTTFTEPAALSLLECRLETGRTHQIRVHLAAIGHPLVGDARYHGARAPMGVGRPFLHAARLVFDHPSTGERCRFESALPPDLPLPPDTEVVHGRISRD